MAHKDDDPSTGSGPEHGGAGPDETGPEENTSGPAPSGDQAPDADGLTIDDILGAEQTPEAAAEDAGSDREASLLIDLKRLQAEYANYRRRTEEQREREIERAKGEAVKGLLPVMDDLDRAAKHGDLVEGSPLAAIGDKVRAVAERLGVVSYGAVGDAFDPQQHEAIFQAPTPGVTETTILEVVEVGYRLGSVELRPAKVVVAVPA